MFSSSDRIHKEKIEVSIELDDGKVITGFLWTGPRTRLTDLLNDDRQFLPFEYADGRFTVINKTAFREIEPLPERAEDYDGTDAYRILGVPRDVRLDDLKQAYRTLCAENHPDRLKGAGATPEEIEVANARMSRINDAYQRIMKQYEDATPAPAA